MEMVAAALIIVPLVVIAIIYLITPSDKRSALISEKSKMRSTSGETVEEKFERLSKKYEVQIIKGHKDESKALFASRLTLFVLALFSTPLIAMSIKLELHGLCGDTVSRQNLLDH